MGYEPTCQLIALRRSPLRWWPRGLGVCHSHLGHAVGTGCLQNLESMPKKEGKDEVFEEIQIIPSYTLFQFPQIFFDPVPFRKENSAERSSQGLRRRLRRWRRQLWRCFRGEVPAQQLGFASLERSKYVVFAGEKLLWENDDWKNRVFCILVCT